MTKHSLAFLFLILLSITTLSQGTEQNTLFKKKSKFAIIRRGSEVQSIFPKDYKISTLNNSEYKIIQNLLIRIIDSFNIEGEKSMKERIRPYIKIDRNAFIIDTSRYRFQLIAVRNKKMQKIVWVNAFCNNPQINWRKSILIVEDGGICYFNLKINLSKRKVLTFSINGNA